MGKVFRDGSQYNCVREPRSNMYLKHLRWIKEGWTETLNYVPRKCIAFDLLKSTKATSKHQAEMNCAILYWGEVWI